MIHKNKNTQKIVHQNVFIVIIIFIIYIPMYNFFSLSTYT